MIDKLYTDYYNKLLWYCISLSGNNHSMAEDIVQETFMRALKNTHILNELTEGQCRSWLYKSAKNIFIDDVRRMANAPKPELQLFKEDDLSVIIVRQLSNQLPANERTLFWMRYIEGYNSSELGEMFNLSPSTVRARLASAREKISKVYFKEKGKGE